MAKLVWDKIGERYYETGIEQGVLYVKKNGVYPEGVAWNGLISVSESPSGAEANPQYADNIKYLNLISVEEFNASVEAFTYPDEFAFCDGSALPEAAPGVRLTQQPRSSFGLVYKTKIGSDVDGEDHGYKLHMVYNAFAAPTDKSYTTVNESPEAITFSWEISTTPVNVEGYKPTAHLVVDSRKADPTKLAALEDELFGSATKTANLPMPDDIITLLS